MRREVEYCGIAVRFKKKYVKRTPFLIGIMGVNFLFLEDASFQNL